MKAAVLEEPGRPIAVRDDVELASPRPGQVRVRVTHCGVCHSDLSIVDEVGNGEDALARVRQEAFDVVLLDEMMPGMGGLATLSEIKDFRPYLPVILITKSEQEELMDEALGKRITEAILAKQYPALQSYVAIVAILYVIINFVIDILYSVLDPRIRNARAVA